MRTPTLHRVPVRGGDLAVAVWASARPTSRTIVAVHGITASHLAWSELAERFPDVRIIAPDLRGRGGSRDLPGPWGMPQHAADLLAVLDTFEVESALVVGHSMGAFVCTTLAAAQPERVAGLVLIDGGLPIPLPEGLTGADLPDALIGPAAERLSMKFSDQTAYRDFWRAHPAFADAWSSGIERYVDYDLVESDEGWRSASSLEAVTEDSLQLNDDTGYLERLAGLTMPLHFLRAPRGLLNQPEALYPPSQMDNWRGEIPRMVVHEIPGVNHYTIVMAPSGLDRIGPIVREVLDACLPVPPHPISAKEHTA